VFCSQVGSGRGVAGQQRNSDGGVAVVWTADSSELGGGDQVSVGFDHDVALNPP
jgi:hypothetical protein